MNRTISGTVAVILGAALGCAGCTQDPKPEASTPASTSTVASPTPSPSPTQKTAEQLAEEVKQANIEAAKQTLLDYFVKANEVSNNHNEGWEEVLRPYWGSLEVIDLQTQAYEQSVAAGLYTEGSTRLASLAVTGYTEDPTGGGYEQVNLRGCFDASQVKVFGPDGVEVVQAPGVARKFFVDYMMQRQGTDKLWTINVEDHHNMEQPC